MDFELTEEQAALREVSRGMLAVNCPPSLVRSLATAGKDVDDKLWQYGAELGWTGLAIPEEHDGGQLTASMPRDTSRRAACSSVSSKSTWAP